MYKCQMTVVVSMKKNTGDQSDQDPFAICGRKLRRGLRTAPQGCKVSRGARARVSLLWSNYKSLFCASDGVSFARAQYPSSQPSALSSQPAGGVERNEKREKCRK
jgi:hypothetical protein